MMERFITAAETNPAALCNVHRELRLTVAIFIILIDRSLFTSFASLYFPVDEQTAAGMLGAAERRCASLLRSAISLNRRQKRGYLAAVVDDIGKIEVRFRESN